MAATKVLLLKTLLKDANEKVAYYWYTDTNELPLSSQLSSLFCYAANPQVAESIGRSQIINI